MLNKVHLIGNVVQDPEIHSYSDGSFFLKFPIVTIDNIVSKSKEKKVLTEVHTIKMLNAGHFLKKNICRGKLVYVEGKIKTEKDPVNNTSEVIIMAYNTRILEEKKEGRMW